MCDNVYNNPFAGLFPTIDDAVSFASQNQRIISENNGVDYVTKLENMDVHERTKPTNAQGPRSSKVDKEVNYLLADVFAITLHATGINEHNIQRLVFIDVDSIEQAVFERLMLSNPESKLLTLEDPRRNASTHALPHTLENQAICYLFECYCRLQRYRNENELGDVVENMQQIILQNAGVALQEPDLFQGQEIHNQFLTLHKLEGEKAQSLRILTSFVNGIVSKLQIENKERATDVIAAAFSPILDIVHKEVAQAVLGSISQSWFTILNVFSSIEALAKLLIRHSTPHITQRSAYAHTLFGALLSLSCLPKAIDEPFYFFEKSTQQTSSAIERFIWIALDTLTESLYEVFHSLLLLSREVRHLTLEWIGNCLRLNGSRGTLWNTQNDAVLSTVFSVSDGFMLNLGCVLLRLCKPFCIQEHKKKVPKIDPTYCAAETNENESSNDTVHLRGLSWETCLIPTSEGETRPVAKKFSFTTECFFLTHRALDLGYRVVLDKLARTNQDLLQTQRAHVEFLSDGSSEVLETITRRMEEQMTKYLSLKASLLAPEMLKLLAEFHATTAFWLVQVYISNEEAGEEETRDYAPKEYKEITFPLPETVPDTLRCIPEFVVENTIRFLCFLSPLNQDIFEQPGFLPPVLTEIIVLMESQQRLYNPHLRARLAEGLEALLPTNDPLTRSFGTLCREQLFITHPYRQHIVPNLLKVFISIEMTGQSVQFVQKFKYRRPMYVVMEYLWKLTEHRDNFITLAKEAESNMEAAQPPLFLHFINLLMNDAVFLLDEALSNMAQLKQLIQTRESGEWYKLPQHEREQQVQYLNQLGMTARFDNILGKKTIETLNMLTTEIKSIFCHPTMVDRIASMLNYLLLQLVGPNQKNLKVNDQKEYAFDPANLVLNICKIYVNLGPVESFTLAVSQDGRSYTPELFQLAGNVLVRIGGATILGFFNQFAEDVETAANREMEEDEILTEAPDEFLDPIMSTLMTDPVILPSSRITVDRQTIARHLLNDQTDPFNRSPLTMDKVISDVALQHKVQHWLKRKKQERKKDSQ